jgi:hypothetical protein
MHAPRPQLVHARRLHCAATRKACGIPPLIVSENEDDVRVASSFVVRRKDHVSAHHPGE